MKFEQPPVKKENTFEETKKKFSCWVDHYLKDLYENGDFMIVDIFHDPIEEKINEIANGGGYITEEAKELTVIFGEKLVEFSNFLIFSENYDEKSANKFFNNLHTNFFAKSPTVFENLNIDFLQKTIISSEINETYGLRKVVDISGETAYDLSFCSKGTLKKMTGDIKKLTDAKKISAIKQLSGAAMRAAGEGEWAEEGYNNVLQLIKELKETESSPIVSFILDFELEKIRSNAYSMRNSEKVDNIKDKVRKESTQFFDKNKIIPEIKDVSYSKVSKDYGSIVLSNNLTPVALVKNKENLEENKEEKQIFSLREIENLKMHLKDIILRQKKDGQFYIDIGSIACYLNNKSLEDSNLSEVVRNDTLEALNKNFDEIEELVKKLNRDHSLWKTYENKMAKIVNLAKEININELKNFVETLISKNKIEYTPLPIKSYDGLTKDKEFNPLGNDDFSHLVKIFHSPEIRNYINNRLNIKIEDLLLKEQIYFLKFLSGSNEKMFAELENTLKDKENKSNINYLRSFLSMSGDSTMGNKIVALAENLQPDISKQVFAKYGEIIDSADKAEEEVKKLYEKENIPGEVFESIKETLLKKGVELLRGLSDSVKDGSKINEQEILNKLEDIKISTIIMGSSYIELYKQGIKVPIEDIKNTSIEKISAKDLDEKSKKELLKVYEKGRPKETYENKEHIKLLTDEFEQTLNNKDTFVFNVRFNGEIVAFATFNKESEDTLHIGGLTFIDDVRNPAVGATVMNSIMNEFGDYNIKALVHSENKVLKMYQNRFGFKIVKELPREENAGELYFEIERPKNKALKNIEMNSNLEKAA